MVDGDFLLAAGATAQFDGAATFADATDFVNANEADTTVVVNAAVDIGVGAPAANEDFNWDGGGFATNETIVNATGDLDIRVENLDLAGDTYNGTITMNSGDISVQVGDGAWIMARTSALSSTLSSRDL